MRLGIQRLVLAGLTAWATWTGTFRGASQVTITEFMAANAKTLADEDREYSDWLELYNADTTAVDLGGWVLTDSTDPLKGWVFPSTNLPPNSYLVVFASGKNRTVPGKELHTDFSLNDGGEYLALLRPEGEEPASEFAPGYPPQFTDVSYGVYQGRCYYFPKPTPRAPNVPGYENFVADTKFDHDRGFHSTPFDLTIATATPGATIVYTTNGTLPSLTNGITYTAPVHIAGTTVLRAAAFKTGFQPSNVDTQTYLFLDDIIHQSPTGQPPPGWPSSWGSNVRDYGMDPDIVNSAKYKDTIKDDLKTIPSFSMVMDLNDLFSSSRGIYANASQEGRNWERKCSLELIYPDGTKGFQIDCGVRIRGGYSRSTGNPKHAFRYFFRDDYGAPKLKYALFGNKGADSFDCIDLRCSQNYSWSFEGDTRGIHLRDQFSRDTQLDMGHNAERGNFYHLYINGQYWGLYNTCERPEASYGATYFGGNKEDYDTIKVEAGPYTIFATDGTMAAWTRLYNMCKSGTMTDELYQKTQGNNADGTRNPQYENLLDVDNLIDYMLVIFYGGNLDAPISNFLGNSNPNNWYGVRNRLGQDGFRFFAHDSEHTLLNVSENRTGPYSAGNSSVSTSSPQWVFQRLAANAEFKVRVGDHVHKHFFNGGLLTPDVCAARLMRRKDEIDRAVVGESARWGDAKRATPITRDDWLNTINGLLKNYFPQRSGIVLNQLKTKGWYPGVVAPTFSQHGGPVEKGFKLTMTMPAGTIYYTLDGSDPRLRGGTISPGAQTYLAPVTINETIQVKSRVLDGTNWSALNAATFTVIQAYTNLLITEIMYNPLPEGAIDGDQFEFIELKNVNPVEIDLGGVHFTNGIDYVFPNGTRLGPGQFVVLVHNPTNFANRYPDVRVDGVYTHNLANGGERITLVHAVGTPIFSVAYHDQPPWPTGADGQGFSLVPVNPNVNVDPDNPASWRASSLVGGSPGSDDPPADIIPVVVNEVLAHTDPPMVDSIELHNPTATDADISYWFLTDDRRVPKKFCIPAKTVIPPGGYVVFDETQFNPTLGVDPSFALSSHGEDVFLYSADAAGNLTGYSDGFAFGAAANGVTFGRYTNSVGEIQYPAQCENSLGEANRGPRVGPVVINEICCQPAAGGAEFIELKNITAEVVRLYDPAAPTNTWHVEGIGFDFPTNVELAPRGLALVVGSDPALFRARYNVPANVPVWGPYQGVLQDNGELLELQRPDTPEVDTNGVVFVPYITVDAVRYSNKAPWPTAAAGSGSSLERIQSAAYGNDPANWVASFGIPSPGLENTGNRLPVVNAGADCELQSATFPAVLSLQGTVADDGLPKPPGCLSVAWSQVNGPGTVVFASPSQTSTTVAFPGVGTYVLKLTANDGELQASDDVMVTVSRPAALGTIIPAGSEWKYLDDGSNQETAWRALTFDDSNWKSGKAQLGYGDGDEATVVSYGDDSQRKFITTYFRKTFTVVDVRSVTALTLKVVRDDGIVVYLNGNDQPVMKDNMPEDEPNYQTFASNALGGTDESAWIEKDIAPASLREGTNVLAVEIHQCNLTSSDISFDLQLDALAFPSDQPPTASAGPDLAVELPATATLAGSFSDDGLPNPPGVVSAAWSKVSGPGTVSFADASAWVTTATFSEAGDYALRLTVNDGASAASAETTVKVTDPIAVQIVSAELISAPNVAFRIRFTAPAGKLCVVEYRDSLTEGAWQTLTEVQAGRVAGPLESEDAFAGDRRARFYRVVAW